MEFVRQEPPGKSTNSTAGCDPAAWRSRSPSASLSQPSLLTGTSAWAMAEWDTMTPRSGSLIVFLEVLLRGAFFAHAPDQAVVEDMRRIHAAVAQQVVHGQHFADHRQVLAGIQGHREQRQLDVEELGFLTVESGAVVFASRVPILELHDDLDAFLLAHRADA